jgi:polysaccharide export outer membrane protein
MNEKKLLMKAVVAFVLIMLVAACSSNKAVKDSLNKRPAKKPPATKIKQTPPIKKTIDRVKAETQKLDYIIGPEDLLEISVFGLPEMNKTVRVSAEGTIVLPLLRSIQAEGYTQKELEERIANLLAEKYVQNPQVSIFIKEHKSRQVAILGAVEKPGFYELIGKRTILDIIALSGGISENAGKELLLIRRSSANKADLTYKINLEELFSRGNPALNKTLQEGDVINVPVDKIINIYVLGAVNNPGALAVKQSENITVLQAIAKAGGFSERAAKTRVKIVRQLASGKKRTIKINVKDIINGKKEDMLLQEGDVIVVPETFF